MNTLKSLLILDSAPQPEWNFKPLLEQATGREWEIWHPNSSFSDKAFIKRAKFFLFPLKLLARRREIGAICSYQQFYGLIYAYYCELLRLKKSCALFIAMFIYKPRGGLIGRAYFRFVKRAVCSRAVDKIICFSAGEVPYYQALFGAPDGRFVYIPLGLGDRAGAAAPRENGERFILCAGKSNRDYGFIYRALSGSGYKTRILCGDMPCRTSGDISVYHSVYGEEYFDMLARCWCVVVPLADRRISSGQLSILQAMMYSKPVIATLTSPAAEYIRDGETGFLFETESELLALLQKLEMQPELCRRVAQNGRRAFEREHGLEAMARAVGKLVAKAEACYA